MRWMHHEKFRQGVDKKLHLIFERDLIGSEVAHILVVMVQQCHSRPGAVIQELHAQNLQLINSDVTSLMETHGVHGNDLRKEPQFAGQKQSHKGR